MSVEIYENLSAEAIMFLLGFKDSRDVLLSVAKNEIYKDFPEIRKIERR